MFDKIFFNLVWVGARVNLVLKVNNISAGGSNNQ